jgi:hypothetical protein
MLIARKSRRAAIRTMTLLNSDDLLHRIDLALHDAGTPWLEYGSMARRR